MGDLIAMVKDAVVPLAGFMAVTAMLGVVIVMYKQTIMAVINTLLYSCLLYTSPSPRDRG